MENSKAYVSMKKRPRSFLAIAALTFSVIGVFFFIQLRAFSEPAAALIGASHTSSNLARLLDNISNTTLGFQKILAINLPERTDHRDGLILAAAVSNIAIDFVNGVPGNSVLDKVLPPGDHKDLEAGNRGSWRAHINALTEVVRYNYSTALIMEDDVDWDIRLKSILKDFALSHNALEQDLNATEIDFDNLPPITTPKTSPYGDSWDILWLGHCGLMLPPSGFAIHKNDPSVPETQYLHSWDPNEPTPMTKYPQHTRLVMRQIEELVCTFAYGVSQAGARKLLYSLGLKKFDQAYDLMLRDWCNGSDGNEPNVCPAVMPTLFDHHRREGSQTKDSDIKEYVGPDREKAMTPNIRWSVRMNMEKILKGDKNYDDQYPNTLGS